MFSTMISLNKVTLIILNQNPVMSWIIMRYHFKIEKLIRNIMRMLLLILKGS